MLARINCSNKINRNKVVSFGTVCTNYHSDKYKCQVATYTNMFRSDLDWDKLTDYIVRDDKPKKIYCYACSDGSEPYSIALALISRLGVEKSKKYFPIIARDIDKSLIDKAKRGLLMMDKQDLSTLRKNNINSKSFFDYQYYTYTPSKKGVYKVKDVLRSCVDFDIGDIFKDAKNLEYDNMMLFFRNVWMYIPTELQSKLVGVFNKTFKDTTSLVIGSLDMGSKAKDIPQKYKIPVYKIKDNI